MHAFNLVKFHDYVTDFGLAWSLQAERRLGRRLPPRVTDPAFVQYYDSCALAGAVERALGLLGPEKVQFLVFEDFVAEPSATMARVWAFLGLEPMAVDRLPRVNAHRRWRQPRLAKMLTDLPAAMGTVYGPAKRLINRLGIRPGRALHKLNEVPAEREPMSPPLRQDLLEVFRENNERLRLLLDHPLDAWRS